MHSAIVLALAAGALAVPHKRDVVTDYDIVYQTDVVTVWANAQPTSSSSVAVAAAADDSAPSSSFVMHYGHNHWGHSSEASTASPYVAPTTSTSVYVAPVPTTPSSTYVAPPAPTTPSSTYVALPAPTTSSSTYVAPPPPTTSSTTPAPALTTISSSAWNTPSPYSSSAWAATSSSAAAAAKPTSYSEIVVYHHNIHRANHSAPPISWSDDLAATADIIAAKCLFEHDTTTNGGGYGQNLAMNVDASNISAIVSEVWYNGEVGWYEDLYNQAQPDMTNFEHWGHFSQLVWKDTTQVGCATNHCPQGISYMNAIWYDLTVCNYKAPGNVDGGYANNVGDSLKEKTLDWSAGL